MNINLTVTLLPISYDLHPTVIVGLTDNKEQRLTLHNETIVEFNYNTEKTDQLLTIEFYGKEDNETQGHKDKAVIVRDIGFFGITDPKFVWAGEYRPAYPEPYYQSQLANGTPPAPVLLNASYMGWNGVWSLEFTAPVFTWIHHKLDFGWIHH